MPVKGAKLCGAKCRTKGGEPCAGPAMKNGRCRMHGGVFYKRETHGKTTLRAKEQRKKERAFLKEMRALHRDLNKEERVDLYEKMRSGEASAHELVRLSLLMNMISEDQYRGFLALENEKS